MLHFFQIYYVLLIKQISKLYHYLFKYHIYILQKCSYIFENNLILKNTIHSIISTYNEDDLNVKISLYFENNSINKPNDYIDKLYENINNNILCNKEDCDCFITFKCLEILSKFLGWNEYELSIEKLFKLFPSSSIQNQIHITDYLITFLKACFKVNEIDDYNILYNKISLLITENEYTNDISWDVQIEIIKELLILKDNSFNKEIILKNIKQWYNNLHDIMKQKIPITMQNQINK